MKKVFYVVLSIAVLSLLFSTACSSTFNEERTAVVTYLTDFNQIDSDLNQTLSSALTFASLSSVEGGINAVHQVTLSEEGAMQRLYSLEVPNIAEVKSQYDAYMSVLETQNIIIQKVKTAIANGDQLGGMAAYNEFNATSSQVSSVHRAIESLMAKYDIIDSQVNYQMRGK